MIKILAFKLLAIIYSLANTQSAIVSYKTEYTEDKKHEFTEKVKSEFELMEFTLTFDSKKSHFKKEKNIYKDYLSNSLAVSIITAQSDFVQENKKAYSNKVIGTDMFIIDRSYRMQDWELTNETAKINNYVCYKAVLKEYNSRSETYFNTTAWYTPEIPVGYGPIGYGGLPGLILQLEYKKVVFSPTTITLNPKELEVKNLEKGKVISEKEMVKLMRAARKVTKD